MNTDFESVIKELGFGQSIRNSLEYIKIIDGMSYKIEYEGYAYVLYRTYYINQNFEYLPIAHFQDADKFKTFFEILTDKFNGDEEN